MEDLDARILRMLQKDGKLSYEQIGKALRRSPSTIRDRIRKMEEDRTILGYAAVVDHEKMGIGADAYISSDLAPEHEAEAMMALSSFENVSEVLRITGERRIVFRARAASNKDLTEFVDKRIRPLGFCNIELTIVLESIVRYPGL